MEWPGPSAVRSIASVLWTCRPVCAIQPQGVPATVAAGRSGRPQGACGATRALVTHMEVTLHDSSLRPLHTHAGGGFSVPYFASVCETLLELGILQPGSRTCLTAGSSAGSLVAVCVACGIHPSVLNKSFQQVSEDCR